MSEPIDSTDKHVARAPLRHLHSVTVVSASRRSERRNQKTVCEDFRKVAALNRPLQSSGTTQPSNWYGISVPERDAPACRRWSLVGEITLANVVHLEARVGRSSWGAPGRPEPVVDRVSGTTIGTAHFVTGNGKANGFWLLDHEDRLAVRVVEDRRRGDGACTTAMASWSAGSRRPLVSTGADRWSWPRSASLSGVGKDGCTSKTIAGVRQGRRARRGAHRRWDRNLTRAQEGSYSSRWAESTWTLDFSDSVRGLQRTMAFAWFGIAFGIQLGYDTRDSGD